ncbi:hypothetical protein CAPTEDRAFT_54120, partial [Capitella teleta]
GHQYTFAELEDVVHNIACHLQSLGFTKGSNLALCASNCVEIPIMILASWKLGGMVTVINPLLKPDEVRSHLVGTKPNFIFLDKEHHEKLKKVIQAETVPLVKEGVEGHRSFASLKDPIQHELKCFARDVESEAAIFFSSGTTGSQKAVVLTHRNIVAQLEGIATLVETDMLMMAKWTCNVICLPLSHVLGLLFSFLNMRIGATTIIMPRFDPKKYLELNSEFKCELIVLVPPIAVFFVKNRDLVKKYDLSNIHSIACGAAVL